MKIFKPMAFALILSFTLLLSGCSLLSTGDELLKAPEAGGEVSEIKEALDSLVSGKYTLKYPTDGQYRSAIVRYDLTGDGKDEAIAFYSTLQENITQMHVAVLTEKNGKWQASKDAETLASGVEQVQFCDLNSDGLSEILVGWNVVGNVDKQVSVYSFDGSILLPRAEEKYTEFLCCDLNTDQKNELLLLHLNTTEAAASARLLELTENGINEVASTLMDGTVASYFGVTLAKLMDGKTAVFADGKKGNGATTEIIYLAGDTLVNPLFDPQTGKNLTERPFNDGIFDINGDGSPDIPVHIVAPGFDSAAEGDREYITKWCSYSGKALVVNKTAITDIADGYYIEIPKGLQDKITLLTSTDGKVKTVSLYDAKKNQKTDVLFKIKETLKKEWKEENGWIKAAETETLIISVQASSYKGEYSRSAEEIARSVILMKEGESK